MKIKELASGKKKVIRLILFVCMFVAALTAFSYGMVGLSKNKQGYQDIYAESDEEAVLYAHDYTFKYYFTGRSGEIKEQRKRITSVYSYALKRAYKLTDPKNTYTGFTNIASINENRGEPLAVGVELYEILKDAYAKTVEQKGYNMFAGALYSYWESILILDHPEEFDPLVNPDTAERISRLTGMYADPANFSLEFIDDEQYLVSFTTSPGYDREAEELEENGPVLDLNLLRDAYVIEIVGQALIAEGFTDGYITSVSGLTYALDKQHGMEYCIYGMNTGIPAILETARIKHRSAFSCFKAFGFGREEMYHTLNGGGRTVYRNPYISALDGYSSDRYLSLYNVLNDGDAALPGSDADHPCAGAVYRNIRIWSGTEEPGDNTYYVLQEEPGTVRTGK